MEILTVNNSTDYERIHRGKIGRPLCQFLRFITDDDVVNESPSKKFHPARSQGPPRGRKETKMEIEEVAPSCDLPFRLRDERKLARGTMYIFFLATLYPSFPHSRDNNRIFGLVEREIREMPWLKRPSAFFKLTR